MDKTKKIRLILRMFDEKILNAEETIEKIKIAIKEVNKYPTKTTVTKKENREKIKLFSASEIRYIKKNEKTLGISQIAKDLGRNYQTIYNKIQKMKLKKGKRHDWTKKIDHQIGLELELGTTQKRIAEKLNISLPSLKHRIRKLRGQE